VKREKRDTWINFRKGTGFLNAKAGGACNKQFPLNSSLTLTLKLCKLFFAHTVEFMFRLILTLHKHYMVLNSTNTLVVLKETDRVLCGT
jgi:hypothetical protein